MGIHIRKILCPLDFSGSSEHALLYAKAFAQAHDAELVLLHVIESPPYCLAAEIAVPASAVDQTREHCTRNLESVAETVRGEHANTQYLLADGMPSSAIVEMADRNEIDLIVMGTHGRTGLVHALMGSVAEKVVRRAPCPVLTIKHPEHEFVVPSDDGHDRPGEHRPRPCQPPPGAGVSGRCHCGQVRYEATGPVAKASYCDCRGCQRATGTLKAPFVTFRRANVTVVAGQLAEFKAEGGEKCDRHGTWQFCPKCGTQVFWKGSTGDELDILAGTLDDTSAFQVET